MYRAMIKGLFVYSCYHFLFGYSSGIEPCSLKHYEALQAACVLHHSFALQFFKSTEKESFFLIVGPDLFLLGSLGEFPFS